MCSSITVLSLLSLFAAATAADPTTGVLNKRQTPTGPCSKGVHVIAAGGRGPENIGRYGLIGSLSTSIMNAIPSSSNVSLPYPKEMGVFSPGTDIGTDQLVQYVTDYHDACPETKQVLIGYSMGGIIVMNGVCGRLSEFKDTISAVVVYGDQTRVAGQSYDTGTCTTSGRAPRDPGPCGKFASKIQSYCDFDDPQCCVPGWNDAVHFSYPKYDWQATEFVKSMV